MEAAVRASGTEPFAPPPGDHGGDGRALARRLGLDPSDILDLSASLNPLAPDVGVLALRHLGELARYPDSDVATGALASVLGVEPERVLLTNGGAEAIALVAGQLGSGWVDEPAFSLYRRHLAQVEPGAPRWVANPSSPMGELAPADATAAVFDEAFWPLATGTWTRRDFERGALVVGSLTKTFACPGLRLGYVVGDEATIERLRSRQASWSVGSLATAVLPALLEQADLASWAKTLAGLRSELVRVLGRAGVSCRETEANWVLVDAEGPALRERLARRGVLIRDLSSFGLAGWARVAVPDARGLERIERALLGSRTRPKRPLGAALMVCGTSSDAGKSLVVAGLCRAWRRRGIDVAPFKAQNMSLNSTVTAEGGEIARAQAAQAFAAGVEASVWMNPVLLKPTGERASQLVVLGRPEGTYSVGELTAAKKGLWPVVTDALERLREEHELVVLEGAGSPAEVNLLEGDLVNLRLADAASLPAILVADIERGGAFASLVGTYAVLPELLATHLRGFVLNRFRGEGTLLSSGLERVRSETGMHPVGVLPLLEGPFVDAEDSLGLFGLERLARRFEAEGDLLDVAVVALPHIANFTDFEPLAASGRVALRLVDSGSALRQADLVVLPGSKATVEDLAWLRRTGLAEAIRSALDHGATLLGICAGAQMLGRWIDDPVESGAGRVEGLGWLEVDTVFEPTKVTRLVDAGTTDGGLSVFGYEIHHGRVRGRGAPAWLVRTDGAEGAAPVGWAGGVHGASERSPVRPGAVLATTLHGLFEADGFREAFLDAVAKARGRRLGPARLRWSELRDRQVERLADAMEAHLDMAWLSALAGLSEKVGR